MSQDIAVWTACQRLFNLTPYIVRDDGDKVQFLAQLHEAGLELCDAYEGDSILAIGCDDEDLDNEIFAAIDEFEGKPCIVFAHAMESRLDASRSLTVVVFRGDTPENRLQAIGLVKAVSLPDEFEDRTQVPAEREGPRQGLGGTTAAKVLVAGASLLGLIILSAVVILP